VKKHILTIQKRMMNESEDKARRVVTDTTFNPGRDKNFRL
jgi:hypothetical protein